jgi:putative transposase
LEDIARLSVRLVFQAALEAEVTDFLGRTRYARGNRARAGSRNGYSDITVKTTAGAIELKRPKLRGTDETFASRLLGKQVTRTNALEALAISGWVRGFKRPRRPGRPGQDARGGGHAVQVHRQPHLPDPER